MPVPQNQALLTQALTHHQLGDLETAAQLYRRILQSNPNQPDALYLYGCLHQQNSDYPASRGLLKRATELAPNQPEYFYALGLAHIALNDHAAAIASFNRTLELNPKHAAARPAVARALYAIGCVANEKEDYVSARDSFRKAVELLPDSLEAQHNLGRACYELGQVSEAFAAFKRAAAMNREGSEHSRAMLAIIAPGVPELNNSEILETRAAWAVRDLHQPLAALASHTHNHPVRLGYISSFFQRDNWMKPVWGLINRHNREAFQIHLFADCAAADIKHAYQPHASDAFFDTSALTNPQLAALIQKSEIDVLIDLNGYSNMRRLPLWVERIAPVMLGWFNMYASSGIGNIDYLIGDAEVVPAAEEVFYSEKIARVTGSYLTFDVAYPVPGVVARPAAAPFIYGALASQYKITDEVIAAWSEILNAVPASKLLIKNKRLASESVRLDLAARFQKFAVAPERLILEGPSDHFEFLRAYDRIDLALDTFPYNGGTTTTEALWQGVPVLTFHGDRWASRTSASILRAANLDAYIAPNLNAYIARAIELSRNTAHLRAERLTMREKLLASPVCDTRSFALEMETIYQQLLSAQ